MTGFDGAAVDENSGDVHTSDRNHRPGIFLSQPQSPAPHPYSAHYSSQSDQQLLPATPGNAIPSVPIEMQSLMVIVPNIWGMAPALRIQPPPVEPDLHVAG